MRRTSGTLGEMQDLFKHMHSLFVGALFSLLIAGSGCKPQTTQTTTRIVATPTLGSQPGSENAPAISAKEPPKGPSWRIGYERPSVIDVHGHISPRAFRLLRSTLDENGIRSMVNLSGGSTDKRILMSQKMNQREPRLIPFYSPRWRRAAELNFGLTEAKRLKQAVSKRGFRGLKIAKILGIGLRDVDGKRIPVDWPELDPLWEMAGKLGVPVAIHTGDPKAFWDPVNPENERYEELSLHPSWSMADPSSPSRQTLFDERNRMIKRHPKTTFICVHFGNNPEDLNAVDAWLNTYPNMLIDTSARIPEFGRHPPKQVREFFIRHKERILFGTDLGLSGRSIMLGSHGRETPTANDIKPFYDAHWRYFEGSETQIDHPTPIQGKWKIDAVNLPSDVLEHLYWKNAVRVLKLKH